MAIPCGIASCSSDDAQPAAPADAGPDSSRPETGPFQPIDPDAGGKPITRSECIAACRGKHPTGFDKDKAIEACWAASCVPACADGPPGDAGADAAPEGGTDAGDGGIADAGEAGAPPDAGPGDAGASDAAAPACKNDVSTGVVDCDYCTKLHCCAAWDGCFDDPECAALNECIQVCDSL